MVPSRHKEINQTNKPLVSHETGTRKPPTKMSNTVQLCCTLYIVQLHSVYITYTLGTRASAINPFNVIKVYCVNYTARMFLSHRIREQKCFGGFLLNAVIAATKVCLSLRMRSVLLVFISFRSYQIIFLMRGSCSH